MCVLHDRQSRQYVTCVIGIVGSFVLVILFLAWFHGKETQSLLFERERTMSSSLMEQGISPAMIASAIKNAESTREGAALLKKIGHTETASVRLFPDIDRSVRAFAGIAAGMAALPAIALAVMSIHFLWKREKMYRQAESIISQFSEGNFERHLPQNAEGSIYQLFSAVEELAVALRAQSRKEQQMKAFLKDTISDISHQLKTPLAALHMYTEIIAEEPGHKEIVERFSEKTMQSLERIEQLVQALLKVSRIDAGSIVFHKEWHSALALIESAAADLSVRAQKEGKKLIMEGDPAQMLLCDGSWTREAVANLIKNALDHTDEGGVVTVSWECSPAVFRMTVSDDGCGIAEEDIYHVFKRFYRSKRDDGRQGIGLGLPLAKSIVEGQDGILSVSSTPGEGTVFTITFLSNL